MISLPVCVIGVVHTQYESMEETPIQAALNWSEHAVLDMDPAYQDGLEGLEGFDYAWLLTWLNHRPDDEGGRLALPNRLRSCYEGPVARWAFSPFAARGE